MTGHAQPQAMRFGGQRLDEGRVHRVVQLDLEVATVGIPAHRIETLVKGRDNEAIPGRVRAAPFDETVGRDAGAGDLSAVQARQQVLQEGVDVAHVAGGRHAGGQVEQARAQGRVRVHIVQARVDHPALAFDDHLVGRRAAAIARQDLHDPVAHHDQCRQRTIHAAARIEDVHIAQPYRHPVAMGDLGADRAHALDFQFAAQRQQGCGLGLVALANSDAARTEGGEQALLPIEHQVAGLELHPIEAVHDYLGGGRPGADRHLAQARQRDATGGQDIELAIVAGQRRARIDAQRPWAVVVDDVQRRLKRRHRSLVGLAGPARAAIRPIESLVDAGPHQRRAANLPAARDAIRAEHDLFTVLGPAAVVVDPVVDRHAGAVGHRHDAADLLSIAHDGQCFRGLGAGAGHGANQHQAQ